MKHALFAVASALAAGLGSWSPTASETEARLDRSTGWEGGGWVGHPEDSVAGARPNIILFVVDDLGWQDTSVQFHTDLTPFNRRYRTPHMEALAARGTKFTQAYASAPVCTPTRTSEGGRPRPPGL